SEDTNRVVVDGQPVSPVGLQVRAVLDVDDTGVLVSASEDPTQLHLVRVGYDGTTTPLTGEPGVHNGTSAGGTTVVSRSCLDAEGVTITVHHDGMNVGQITSLAADPGFRPQVTPLVSEEHGLHVAALFPRDHTPGSR